MGHQSPCKLLRCVDFGMASDEGATKCRPQLGIADAQIADEIALHLRRPAFLCPQMNVRGFKREAVERNIRIPGIDVVGHLTKVRIVDCLPGTGSHSERLVEFARRQNSNGDFITLTDSWGAPSSMVLALLRAV